MRAENRNDLPGVKTGKNLWHACHNQAKLSQPRANTGNKPLKQRQGFSNRKLDKFSSL